MLCYVVRFSISISGAPWNYLFFLFNWCFWWGSWISLYQKKTKHSKWNLRTVGTTLCWCIFPISPWSTSSYCCNYCCAVSMITALMSHALSHALATTVLAELSQGCNVPNKINWRGEEKSGLLEDKNFKPYWLETNIVHMQDIRKKISLESGCAGHYGFVRKGSVQLVRTRGAGEVNITYTQLITNAFCLWKIHTGSIIPWKIVFVGKRCRFMACQHLVLFFSCCICWIAHTRRIRSWKLQCYILILWIEIPFELFFHLKCS